MRRPPSPAGSSQYLRSSCCLVAVFVFILLFTILLTVTSARSGGPTYRRGVAGWLFPGCDRPYGDANQSLHAWVNERAVDSLALATPSINRSSHFSLVIMIVSAIGETEERAEIRATWAAEGESRLRRHGKAVVFFLLGRSEAISQEAAAHGDILQVDVEDTYRNLVYKIEAGLRWTRHRLRADFVVKIDSDYTAAIDRLHHQLHHARSMHDGPWIGGFVGTDAGPIRNKCQKWYISPSDYPSSLYPPFARGLCYALDRSALERVVDAMGEQSVLEVEDVFLTGIVANATGITPVNIVHIIPPAYTTSSSCDARHHPLVSVLTADIHEGHRSIGEAWQTLKHFACPNQTVPPIVEN